MNYSYEDLISDLNNNEIWNAIRKKAIAGKLDPRDTPENRRSEVKRAMEEYFKRRSADDQEKDSGVHDDIPHFCRDGKLK